MKSLICFAVVLITIACTETNNYYFVYSDGEWVKVDENPMADKDHQEVDISQDDSDNENVDVNDDGEVVNEEDLEPDEDSNFLDEENPEELLPDQDVAIPDDVCVYLKERATLNICYLAQDGEKIFIAAHEKEECEAVIESSINGYRYYYGIELPFYSKDNNSVLDAKNGKIYIDEKEFMETSC